MTKEEVVARYMKTPINKWPEDLKKIARDNSLMFGFCGEICVASIEEWYDKFKKND